MKTVLDEVNQLTLKPSIREYFQLKKLCTVLQPFLEVQAGDNFSGCWTMTPSAQSAACPSGPDGCSSEARFAGIFAIAGLMPQVQRDKPLKFPNDIYFIADVLNSNFWWLQKVSDHKEETSTLKEKFVSALQQPAASESTKSQSATSEGDSLN